MKQKLSIDELTINYLKSLGIDMINQAKSGHPGIVLGAAPIMYALYKDHIIVSNNDPNWINRDRFVLSAGHGSALLYSTLYMAGYNISIDDLKGFRQINSKTPGHPECGLTPGVDMTTGPLGQGFASAVGMALGEKMLQNKYFYNIKKRKIDIFDYKVYVLCGDGDLMEGISSEAASLAGNLNLNNLIVLYDSNSVSLDGKTNKTFTENVRGRFESYGWKTLLVKDGGNYRSISSAIAKAKRFDGPTLIEIKTIIGNGSALQGTNEVHGKNLGMEDIKQLKEKLMIETEPFVVPNTVIDHFKGSMNKRCGDAYSKWSDKYKEYETLNGNKLVFLQNPNMNIDLCSVNFNFEDDLKEATRVTNGYIMNKLATSIPHFLGGSADLSSSTKTYLSDFKDITADNYDGKNIWFGVREHAMGAILNGLALTGFRPFGSTFLVFADYMKPAIRLSALMKLPVTYIFTHDSVNLGEDGATHQPIEQLAMLRSIPNLKVYRPADAHEIVGCWNEILNNVSPSALILSRSDVNLLKETDCNQVKNGAYIVRHEINKLDGIIIATGSEVQTAYYIANELYNDKNIDIRVVSMPSMELYNKQDDEYKDSILPIGVKKIVVEAGTSFGWEKFVYNDKYLITINKFGTSGKKDDVLTYCDFNYKQIKDRVEKLLR